MYDERAPRAPGWCRQAMHCSVSCLTTAAGSSCRPNPSHAPALPFPNRVEARGRLCARRGRAGMPGVGGENREGAKGRPASQPSTGLGMLRGRGGRRRCGSWRRSMTALARRWPRSGCGWSRDVTPGSITEIERWLTDLTHDVLRRCERRPFQGFAGTSAPGSLRGTRTPPRSSRVTSADSVPRVRQR